MSGWLEASWWNVAAIIVPVLGASLAIRLALTPRRPVPGEERGGPPRPAAAHSPDRRRPPLAPGHIPPPPAAHSCGGVARLIDIRRNGCIWVWRSGYGWQQAAVCIPSDQAWDEWLATLPLEDK